MVSIQLYEITEKAWEPSDCSSWSTVLEHFLPVTDKYFISYHFKYLTGVDRFSISSLRRQSFDAAMTQIWKSDFEENEKKLIIVSKKRSRVENSVQRLIEQKDGPEKNKAHSLFRKVPRTRYRDSCHVQSLPHIMTAKNYFITSN